MPWTPELCASWGAALPELAARLSPGRLSQRGLGLALHHSVLLRGLRKGL